MNSVSRFVVAMLAALSAAGAQARDSNVSERISLGEEHQGKQAVSIDGSVTGSDTRTYVFAIDQGRLLTASFHPRVANCFMNVYVPGSRIGEDAPLLNGAKDGNSFAGTIRETGDVSLMIYITVNDPRQDKICRYTIDLSAGPGAR